MFTLLPPDIQLFLLRLMPAFVLTDQNRAKLEKAIWRLE